MINTKEGKKFLEIATLIEAMMVNVAMTWASNPYSMYV